MEQYISKAIKDKYVIIVRIWSSSLTDDGWNYKFEGHLFGDENGNAFSSLYDAKKYIKKYNIVSYRKNNVEVSVYCSKISKIIKYNETHINSPRRLYKIEKINKNEIEKNQ